MNLYQYCLNNPVNWVDPYGKVAVVDDIVIGKLAIDIGISVAISLYAAYLINGVQPVDLTKNISKKCENEDKKPKYWQYYPADNPLYKSPWFVAGESPPYAPGREAQEALNLPPWNPGTAVREYKPKSPVIAGPRKPKPQPGWGYPEEGKGWEYFDGPFFPDE